MAVLGYDAALLIHDALTRANSSDPRKVKDAINATSGLKGVTGTLTLDENRNPKGKVAVILVPQNGQFKFRAKVPAA